MKSLEQWKMLNILIKMVFLLATNRLILLEKSNIYLMLLIMLFTKKQYIRPLGS